MYELLIFAAGAVCATAATHLALALRARLQRRRRAALEPAPRVALGETTRLD